MGGVNSIPSDKTVFPELDTLGWYCTGPQYELSPLEGSLHLSVFPFFNIDVSLRINDIYFHHVFKMRFFKNWNYFFRELCKFIESPIVCRIITGADFPPQKVSNRKQTDSIV